MMAKHARDETETDVLLPRKKSKKEKKRQKDRAVEADAASQGATAVPEAATGTDSAGFKKSKKSERSERSKSKKARKEGKRSLAEANGADDKTDDGPVEVEAGAPDAPAPVDHDSDIDLDPEQEKTNKKEKKQRNKKDKKRLGAQVDDVEEAELESRENKPTKKSKTADTAPTLNGPGDDAGAEHQQAKKSKEKSKEKSKGKSKEKSQKEVQTDNGVPSTNGHVEPSATALTGGYTQIQALSSLPQTEISAFLSANEIVVTDPLSSSPMRPILRFEHLPSSTLTATDPFSDFKAPTPIQAASWPFGLAGRDIVGVAETGSGKTIAFGLPCVEAVLRQPKPKGEGKIRAVIVSPTRELAMQTSEQLTKLASKVGLKTVTVYGGASKDAQRSLLRKADIIVATPGRLKDFLDDGALSLDKAAFVVLDEADRMLDTGFEDDIRRIIGCCEAKERRQTLMFTATWPQSVQLLANSFMKAPVRIQIGGNAAGDLQANARIAQTVEIIDPREKEQRVLQLLKAQPKGERVLVFCLYKKEATRVEGFLSQKGIKVEAIHGDLRQEQRTRSLDSFKTGRCTVLVATDVAARGLDIPEVKLVINVTFPLTIEDYVHRIGRTGRAGKTGQAITLFTEHDKSHSGELVNILKAANQPVPDELLKFGTTVKKKQHGTYGAFFKDVDMSQKGKKITFDD